MKTFIKTQELVHFRNQQNNISIGFVPTMGALHQGHLELVKKSLQENDFTYVSIFVNPLQFNDKKDFELYPRTTEEDIKLLNDIKTDALFLPSTAEIYNSGFTSDEIDLSYHNSILEGAKRPGHFEGVIKVVSILFKIIQPHKAYFGLKDFQQVKIIQQLVKEKNYPVQIIPCSTIRENNGLAMSSRNKRLTPEARKHAPKIYQWLINARQMYKNGLPINEIKEKIISQINADKNFILDYFEIKDVNNLSDITHEQQQAIALIAVYLDGIRLIDNLEF